MFGVDGLGFRGLGFGEVSGCESQNFGLHWWADLASRKFVIAVPFTDVSGRVHYYQYCVEAPVMLITALACACHSALNPKP